MPIYLRRYHTKLISDFNRARNEEYNSQMDGSKLSSSKSFGS